MDNPLGRPQVFVEGTTVRVLGGRAGETYMWTSSDLGSSFGARLKLGSVAPEAAVPYVSGAVLAGPLSLTAFDGGGEESKWFGAASQYAPYALAGFQPASSARVHGKAAVNDIQVSTWENRPLVVFRRGSTAYFSRYLLPGNVSLVNADYAWTPPQPVGPVDHQALELVRGTSGTFLLSRHQERYQVRRFNGTDFDPPTDVSSPEPGDQGTMFQDASGRLHVTWLKDGTTRTRYTSSADGKRWDPIIEMGAQLSPQTGDTPESLDAAVTGGVDMAVNKADRRILAWERKGIRATWLVEPFGTPLPIPEVLTPVHDTVDQRHGCGRYETHVRPRPDDGRGDTDRDDRSEGLVRRRRCVKRVDPCPDDYRPRGDKKCISEFRYLRIPIQASQVQVLPGEKTPMWTFAGTFPGPTIRMRSGEPVRMRFDNQLNRGDPEGASPVTIHNHGGHSPAPDDGQPDDFLIQPGESRDYTYPLVQEGRPERAAFQWYHDHLMDRTARNVWKGLAGMMILDDDFDSLLDLPAGEFDVPLMIADRSFKADNQLLNPFSADPRGPPEGVVGDRILVNGAWQPHFRVAGRKYRLRLLNASNFRTYRLRLRGRAPGIKLMTQIGTESGLLPAPVKRTEIELGPAERAEVVVNFDTQTKAAPKGMAQWFLDDVTTREALMRFDVLFDIDRNGRRDSLDDHSSIPAQLLTPPALDPPGEPDKVWGFSQGFDEQTGRQTWTINGKLFEHHRIDAIAPLGVTQRWRLQGGGERHLIHIHAADFRVLSRNGKPPPAWEAGLKESVILEPQETVDIAIRFTDHTGRFVMHCHMIEHEDNGMMTNFEVVSGSGLPQHDNDLLVFAPLAAMLALLAGRRLIPGSGWSTRLSPAAPVASRWRFASIVCLIGIAAAHASDLTHKLHHSAYLATLFLAMIAAAAVLALLMAANRLPEWGWLGAAALSVAALASYLLSRSVGLPQAEHHVGHWLEPAAVLAVLYETVLLAVCVVAFRSMSRGSTTRTRG